MTCNHVVTRIRATSRRMITLYDFGNSVCCQKVRITLRAKGLDWQATPGQPVQERAIRPGLSQAQSQGRGADAGPRRQAGHRVDADLRIYRRGVSRPAAHAGRSVAANAHAAVEQDGRRGPARRRHRDQLFGDVPRADESHAGGIARDALQEHRRSAPHRPLQVDLRARRAIALRAARRRGLRARVQDARRRRSPRAGPGFSAPIRRSPTSI